jgi:hypothetical protein
MDARIKSAHDEYRFRQKQKRSNSREAYAARIGPMHASRLLRREGLCEKVARSSGARRDNPTLQSRNCFDLELGKRRRRA